MEQYEATGLHVVCDMDGVSFDKLDDLRYCMETMTKGIELSGATIVDVSFKKFQPSGLTIVMTLEESHMSLHTYPESGVAMADAFTCGDKNPELSMNYLIDMFKPSRFNLKTLKRGF
jgi:S-adenosylmethionine decarboxylase